MLLSCRYALCLAAQSYCKPRERKRKWAVICINRSHSAEASSLGSALAYSRFSPPIDVPLSLRCVSVPCASFFTAKLGRRTAEVAHLCTFPHISTHFCTLVRISAHFCASPCHSSSKKPDSRRTRYSSFLSLLHTFPENAFHLSGCPVTISIQIGYILNFQIFIFQSMSVISRAECRFSFGADLRFVLLRLKNRSEHNGKSFGL